MRRALGLACAGLLVPAAIGNAAWAQDTAPATAATTGTLDAVTVYATRNPQSTFEVPAMVSTIDAAGPGNATAGDMSDLFEFTPGVEIDNGPRRNGQTVSIRGFDDEAIITLIDGRRQNFEAAHDGRFFVDPALLKSVEVVKGASSSIYGGGGVGGVVAFDTKDAADVLAPGETLGAVSSAGWRSANREKLISQSVFARGDAWDVVGSAAFRDGGDIRQADGKELETDDELISSLFKAGYTFEDFNTVQVLTQIQRNDGEEPNNPAGSITSSNPVVVKLVDDRQYGIKYSYDNPSNDWLQPSAHVYYNDTLVREVDQPGSSNQGRVQIRNLETVGLTLDNKTSMHAGAGQSHTVSYGLEAYKDEQIGLSSSSSDGSRDGVPNAEAFNYGIYVQDEVTLNTDIGRFLVIPAARFDSYESDDEDGNSQEENQISPKLSLSYMPNDNMMVFGSWAQAFRAPNLTEIYASGQHYPGNNYVPNPNLKPETVTTIEIGAGLSFSDIVAVDDAFSVKGSVYRSSGEDFIAAEISGTTTENINIDEAIIKGFEAEAEYRLHPVTAKLGVSYTHAVNDATDEYLSNNVPLTFVADLGYAIDATDGVVGWRSRIAKANTRVGDDDTATGGYGVNDIYYRWQPEPDRYGAIVVDVGIENVFDKAYQKRFASLNEDGRSYTARVSYAW